MNIYVDETTVLPKDTDQNMVKAFLKGSIKRGWVTLQSNKPRAGCLAIVGWVIEQLNKEGGVK